MCSNQQPAQLFGAFAESTHSAETVYYFATALNPQTVEV